MKLARSLVVVTLLSAPMISGCGSSDRLDQDPADLLAQTDEAIAHPSGHLDASSARSVFKNAASQGSIGAVNAFSSVGSGPGGQPMGPGGASCISQSGDIIEMDFACATNGEGTGKMRMKESVSASAIDAIIDYQSICMATNGHQLCIDGFMAMEVVIDKQSSDVREKAYGELDVGIDGVSLHEKFGFEVAMSGQTETIKWVAFDDAGGSYVFEASITGDSGMTKLVDAEGEYTCSYTDGGAAGTCTGPKGTVTWP